MAYLIGKERVEADEKELRDLKSRLVAAHPDWDVEAMFAEKETFAPELTPEEQEQQGPLSANEIEAALNIMKDLGFAVQDLD